jgi:hypothetical protein
MEKLFKGSGSGMFLHLSSFLTSADIIYRHQH